MKNKKHFSVLTPIICGFGAVLLAAALSSLLAFGIVSEFITKYLAEILVPGIIAVAVFTTSLLASINSGAKGRGVAALGSAGIYFLICILVKVILFPGNTQHLLRNFAICTIAAIAAFLLSYRIKEQRRSAHTRKRR